MPYRCVLLMMSFYKQRFHFFFLQLSPWIFFTPYSYFEDSAIHSLKSFLKNFTWEVTRNIRNFLSLTRHLTTMMTEDSFAEFTTVQVHLLKSPPVLPQDKTFSIFWMSMLPSDRSYSQFFRWTLESNSVMGWQENFIRLRTLEVILPKLKAGLT